MPKLETWERCGNTPYYRSGHDLSWKYADPFEWKFLVIFPVKIPPQDYQETYPWKELDPAAGALSVIVANYLKAPNYDWDMMALGTKSLVASPDERKEIRKLTMEWAWDLVLAKEEGKKLSVLRKMFEEAPKQAQDYVLRGVEALCNGYFKNWHSGSPGNPPEDHRIIGIDASKGILPIEIANIEHHLTTEKTVLGNSVQHVQELVLAEFGIHEC